MIEPLNLKNAEVAITKSNTPEEGAAEGINLLGGISEFILEDDQVFMKINLRLPNGFPVNTNINVVKKVIDLCKEAGTENIYIGSFPFKGTNSESIARMIGFPDVIESMGVKLVYLDDYINVPQKIIKIKNKEFEVPKIILESDKIISINQISVDPLFKITQSLANSYSIVSDKYQKIQKILRKGKDYLFLDQYKQDLVSNIIDVFSIKKPNLSINDLFYTLQGAGPYIYKDSNLLKTNLVVVGNDATAVDFITLKLMKMDPMKNELILEAREKRLGITDLQKITLFGEKLDKINLDINFCVSKLEDINVQNTPIKKGRFCSGCFKQAYHLLNLMKTIMTKDLKYIKKQSFLIGENPQEPDYLENILIFGNCAISSSKDRSFRKVLIERRKDFKEDTKKIFKRDKKPINKPKIKEKSNKKILELPGCPPDTFESISSLIMYYNKKQVPNLNLYNDFVNLFKKKEKSSKLKKEGAL